MATLITPYGEEFSITPLDFEAGFIKNEIDQLIRGDGKAFRLKTGDVLLLDSLVCAAQHGERNHEANGMLRNAIHDPGGEVCGWVLLLGQEETAGLSPSLQRALLLDRAGSVPTVLLLARNEEVRSVMAKGLARASFRVVQARTADEALRFCRDYSMHILVADVHSLRPTPLQTLDCMRQLRPQAKALLISGYDLWTVGFIYPGLLVEAEFLQKPFALNVMADTAHWMAATPKDSQQQEPLLVAKIDSG